jgi:hypothetical protein
MRAENVRALARPRTHFYLAGSSTSSTQLKGFRLTAMMIDLCTYLTLTGRRQTPLKGFAGRIALESAVRRMRAP